MDRTRVHFCSPGLRPRRQASIAWLLEFLAGHTVNAFVACSVIPECHRCATALLHASASTSADEHGESMSENLKRRTVLKGAAVAAGMIAVSSVTVPAPASAAVSVPY